MVGVLQASGKAAISTQSATDGTQLPIGILADDVDPSAGDVAGCGVYLKGEFNENAVILGTDWTVINAFAPLRSMGIFLKPAVAASGQYL